MFLGVIEIDRADEGVQIQSLQDGIEKMGSGTDVAQLRLIAEHSTDLLGILDSEGRIVYASPSHRRLLGIDLQEFIGQSLWHWIHPSDCWSVYSTFCEMLGTKEPAVIECRYLRNGEGVLYVEALATPLVDEYGDIRQVVVVARDITDRRKLEQALSETLQRYQSILQNNPDAAVALNHEGYVIEMNPACEKLLGYSQEEFLGKPFDEFLASYHSQRGAGVHHGEEGSTQDVEIDVLHKNGYYVHTVITRIPVVVDGDVVGTYGILKDITQRKIDALRIESQAHISEQIVLERPLKEILTEITEKVEEIFEAKFCSILLLDEKEQRLFTGAAPSLPKRYTDIIHGMKIGPRNGSCGAAAYTKQLQVTEDVTLDEKWVGFRDIALVSGLKSCWSKPIFDKNGSVVGTFAIYSKTPGAPTQNEIELIQSFSHLASVAITKNRSLQEAKHLMYHDPQTGVANQFLFNKIFEEEWSQAQERSAKLGILVFDIDDFLSINRRHGHLHADEYLKIYLEKIQLALQDIGIVSRVGGDAFAVLLTEMEGEVSIKVAADRIQKTLSESITVAGAETTLTASIGAAICPRDGDTIEELLKRADMAMTEMKRKGKNGFAMFRPEFQIRTQYRQRVAKELEQALEEGQFFLVYQPRVDLRKNTVTSLEALIRWSHPTKGIVSPDNFIPIAEETGLIVDIGHWVLRETCSQISLWVENGLEIRVALNVSGRELQEPGFVEQILSMTSSYHIPRSLIEIEITESVLMTNDSSAYQQIKQIRQAGILVSIDDFGTGYSALGLLKRYPLDYVKIDRSFVRDAAHDRQNAIIVKTILQLCSEFGMKVIAEGVETHEEAAFLRENDCHEVQGYLYSKPLSVADCTGLLAGDMKLD